ncbi:hypothetical protein GGR50DRAFT_672726 [Xylaria sp. CBS 124048]|nr:hypothetical protein GGR50DRAFT_672726 [Xylaria sp. CBS 124048]
MGFLYCLFTLLGVIGFRLQARRSEVPDKGELTQMRRLCRPAEFSKGFGNGEQMSSCQPAVRKMFTSPSIPRASLGWLCRGCVRWSPYST